jgi:hypothetical protein
MDLSKDLIFINITNTSQFISYNQIPMDFQTFTLQAQVPKQLSDRMIVINPEVDDAVAQSTSVVSMIFEKWFKAVLQ